MVAAWVTNTVQHFNGNIGAGSRPYSELYNVNPMTPLQGRLNMMGPDGVHRQPLLLTTVGNGNPPTIPVPAPTTGGPSSVSNYVPVPPIPGVRTPATVLPLNDDTSALYLVNEQTLKSNRISMGYWDMILHPSTILPHMYDVLKGIGSYVVWNYQDFVEQFRSWNGTWMGLLEHTGLVWRAFVTAFLTLGLIEIAPILGSLWTILLQLGEVLATVFRWATGVSLEAFHLIGVLWDDMVYMVRKLTSSD